MGVQEQFVGTSQFIGLSHLLKFYTSRSFNVASDTLVRVYLGSAMPIAS